MENVLSYYETLDSYYSSITSKVDSLISIKQAAGQRITITDLLQQYAAGLGEQQQARDKRLAYQFGAEVGKDVDVVAPQEAYDETRRKLADTDTYKNLIARQEELTKRQQEYNDTLDKIADMKKKIADETDTETKKALKEQLKDLQKDAKSLKLTSSENSELKNIQTSLETMNNLLNKSTYYEEIYAAYVDLSDRKQQYESYMAYIADLNQMIKEETDKATKQELIEERKEFQAEAKKVKLSSKENSLLKLYEEQLKDYNAVQNDYGKQYAQAVSKQQELLNRQEDYIKLSLELEDLQSELLDAKQKGDKDMVKYLNSEIKRVKKEANTAKLKSSEEALLKSLTTQIEATEKIQELGAVDNRTATSAQYQGLLKEIGALQSKNKLSNAQQQKLAMYLDELAAINQGVLIEDLGTYMKNYESWWKLSQKEYKSQSEWKKFLDLDATKTSIEQSYQSYLETTKQNLEDALAGSTGKGDLEANYKKQEKELRESYEKQKQAETDVITGSEQYKTLQATVKALEDKKRKAEAKGKTLSAADQKKLEKAQANMDALLAGATLTNLKEYQKYWEWLYNHQAKKDQGKLTKAEQKTWDEYTGYIKKWNEERQTAIDSLQAELEDQLKQIKLEFDTKVGELEAEENEKTAQLYELSKQVAESQITQLQYLIDTLDSQINTYRKLADLLMNLDLSTIRQYNISELFNLDKTGTLEDILKTNFTGAAEQSKELINSLVEQANMYQDLIDAGTKDGFEGIFAKYRETASDEMKSVLDDLIKRLNDNDYTDSEWISEWRNSLSDVMDKILDTIQGVQELKDQLREISFKNLTQAIEMNDTLISKLSSMAGIVQDSWVRDVDGITEFGMAKANLLGQQLSVARDQVTQYAEMIQKIDEAQQNDDTKYATEEEYIKARNEAVTNYYNSISNLEGIANQIYEIGRQNQEQELDNLKKIIDARKKALQAKKSYYDYDKQLKDKNKNIEALESELQALNAVETAEAKARRKQIESDLETAREEFEDMQMEHQFQLESDALDKLVEDMENALDTSAKTIQETFEDFAQTITDLLETANSADVQTPYQKILDLLMGEGAVKYSSSTIDITPTTSTLSSAYTPVSTSDFVSSINSDLSELKVDYSSYLSSMQDSMYKIYQEMTDRIAGNVETIAKNTSNSSSNVTINQSYDSMLHVDGSVDATVVKNLEKLLKQSYEYTREKLYAELKKAGLVRTY